ncbi:HNM1 [[Candida] subhashii]|uniref:HNM1 n=1 Tax=[Candida] subhashii TaxID=561895 RepID=A0A8J5QNR8_9ASCO|nr:HNM1 [[Candida] subhashii]KAG7663765.1 HNM1 [[Candida] subhashii]
MSDKSVDDKIVIDHSFEQTSFPDNEKKIDDYEDTSSKINHEGGTLKRNFSTYSIICIGFGLTNSWLGISSSLVAGISSGGPMLTIYGILIVAAISYCVAVTLGEMSSAIPSAGGQYVWTRVLAPKKYSSFLAYICGSMSWAGAIFTSASMSVALAYQVMGFWQLTHPEHVVQKWELFVLYEIITLVLFVFNTYGKALPALGNGTLYISLFSYTVILITVLVCSRGRYQSAEFVFVQFENNTGWKSSGIAFIVGLINPAWSFSCLDSVTHLSEETSKPRTDIPKAVLSTVTIGFVTAFTYSIAMFYCINNLDDIINSNTGMPILDIFYQALRNKHGALALGSLVFLTATGCTIACHTWQTRICWSFARDNGLPLSKYLAIVDPNLGIPLNAHIFSMLFVALCGLIFLATDAGFNSMIVGTITLILGSYLVFCFCLLYRGRNNIKHGPFWCGKFGLFCNIVTICYGFFALIFFSFPMTMPVTGDTMNYFAVVLAIYVIWALGYWWFPIKSWGCKHKFAGGRQGEEIEFPDVCLTDI